MGKNKAGAVNAALQSIRILALHDPKLAELYRNFVEKQKTRIEEANERLAKLGPAGLVRQINQDTHNAATNAKQALEAAYWREAS
jgi:hypothetical protein